MSLLENALQSRFILASGTATLNAATPPLIAVALTTIEIGAVVVVSLNTVGATPNLGQPYISAITPGTGFTIKGVTNGANDVLNYIVYNK